jgi:23S rRNA (pseudouridine1915-N3)-methyltransferase
MKVFLYYIGKPRDPHANAIAEDFLTRASRWAPCRMAELHPGRQDIWERHPAARRILLDPAGKPMNSGAFAALFSRAEMDGRDLVFLIGGADGLPSGWAARADLLVSLTPMTLPHELARAILAEQIYRAFATLRNHPYPR